MIRFLNKDEYDRTRELFAACFGDEEFEEEYYAPGGDVYRHRVLVREETENAGKGAMENVGNGTMEAAVENAGKGTGAEITAMLHLAPMRAIYADGHTEEVQYIMCVSTAPEYRHRGYMDELMDFAEKWLLDEGYTWTFLVAVDKNIYRHRGYVEDWSFNADEADILYADDGLTDCSAKVLAAAAFVQPVKLEKL